MTEIYYSESNNQYYTFQDRCSDCDTELIGIAYHFQTIEGLKRKKYISKLLCNKDMKLQTNKYLQFFGSRKGIVNISRSIPTDSFLVVTDPKSLMETQTSGNKTVYDTFDEGVTIDRTVYANRDPLQVAKTSINKLIAEKDKPLELNSDKEIESYLNGLKQ